MKKKIEIKVFRNKCVGNRACVLINPKIFKFSNGKVYLTKPTNKKVQTIVGEFDKNEVKVLIKAARLCPVNAISIKDLKSNKHLYYPNISKSGNLKTIIAKYDDYREFKMDNKGYFLIRINKNKKEIEVAFCQKPNVITIKILGQKPIDIYQTIIKEKLISRLDHAAYLGRELQKAKIALDNDLEYIQDSELKLNKN